MPDSKTDILLGLVCMSVFALTLFVLIPLGVEEPLSHDPGQLSPASYPRWIACAGLVLSVLLSLQAFWRGRTQVVSVPSKGLSVRIMAKNTLAFALLLLFYCSITSVGMIIGSFLLYVAFSLLAGERNMFRLLLVGTVLCGSMYVFFVRIATVPIPMGVLQNLL